MKKLFFILFALITLASCGTEPYTCTDKRAESYGDHDDHYPLTPVQTQVLIENHKLNSYLDSSCRDKYYMYHKYIYGKPRTIELVKEYTQIAAN